MPRRRVVQNGPAADGLQRREKANHEPIPVFRGDGLRQPQLRVTALAGVQVIPVQQHDLGQQHRRAVVQMDLGVI
ncbi:hypothetical protein SDC9_116913 [bioreactor metagenome]|uniref:Uncharacterized protein n=1 Tax=bioreactor metagenome TaxID=1076179 RepID=A0A645BXI9_9ZZZZ